MYVEISTPAGTRILVNLDATFCFEELLDKGRSTVNAVSITGIGVPISGMTYDEVTEQVKAALEG